MEQPNVVSCKVIGNIAIDPTIVAKLDNGLTLVIVSGYFGNGWTRIIVRDSKDHALLNFDVEKQVVERVENFTQQDAAACILAVCAHFDEMLMAGKIVRGSMSHIGQIMCDSNSGDFSYLKQGKFKEEIKKNTTK